MGLKVKNNIFSIDTAWHILCTIVTTFFVAMGCVFCDINRFINGIILVSIAIVAYFCIVFFVAKKNWLDIRAVFHAVWVFTVGLGPVRLTNYQEKWQTKTWICFAIAYFVFQIGAHLGITLGDSLFKRIVSFGDKLKIGKLKFEVKENRYFAICIVTTLVGLVCFLISVGIRGFIPCFSDDPEAYLKFYTKFHIFAVASTGVSSLCYYCIATQKISVFKKVILVLCILYSTFLFPSLVVSRGTYIASALALTVTVFYIHKKKFLVLCLCLFLIVGTYFGVSILRNYTDAQLEYFFEPSEIHINIDKDETSSDDDSDDDDDDDKSPSDGDEVDDDTPSDVSFTLPPKLSFVYSYLTVSHDNFNEAVQNSKEYTYGLHQIAPFNSVLRSSWIEKQISESEYFLVRPHLNTINLMGYFYYDFHIFGIVFFMLLWSFVFGLLQKFAEQSPKPFFLLALGNAMVPVALCFFAAWLSVFSQWLLWGVVLIFALAASVNVKFNNKESKKNAED